MTGPIAASYPAGHYRYDASSALWRCGDIVGPRFGVPTATHSGLSMYGATLSSPGGSIRPTGPRYTSYESLYTNGDDLRAVVAKLPAGQILTLPTGLFQFSDFGVSGKYGIQLPLNSGIVGSGRNTIIEMVEHTSTVAGGVNDPPQANSNGIATQVTNQLYLIRMEGTNCVLSNFHLRGTNQSPGTSTSYPNGHGYNGVFQINCTNAISDDLYISGIPGDNGGPPGETFGYNNYNSTGSVISRLEVDGVRQTGDQVGYSVGATGIGDNNASWSTFNNCYVHDNWTGSWAFWQCHDITTNYSRSINNGVASGSGFANAHSAHAINHERTYNMTHNFPTLHIPNGDLLLYPNLAGGTVGAANGNGGFHMSWDSDVTAYGGQAGAFLKVVAPTYNSDSRLANRFIVMSLTPYRGVANIYQKVLPYTVSVYEADGITPLPAFAYAN